MPSCPVCRVPTPSDARYCPACAAALHAAAPSQPAAPEPTSLAETCLPADAVRGTALTPAEPAGPRTEKASHYTAGVLLAGRYRIVGLLGQGGMGEVYRADDLVLGQPVALKFLPRDIGDDPLRLEAFIEEVRSARQVAHANVCRVYDIGTTEDPHDVGRSRRFLSMEFVDGEDLATSLRRIGRFPVDKGLEITRQLCAGLAAVHDRGLLHRDLKPANVMLDGRGRVRITDFGLAGGPGTGFEMAGTPGYMAPELFEGTPATIESDIYALGLVLYEVFSGRRAFEGHSLVEQRRQQAHTRPHGISSTAGAIDPAIEDVIFRCLDPNPRQRPHAAVIVAASLPGGDPLAAALAAGETPSPAMVAAAGENQGLTPRAAMAWGAAFVLLFGLVLTAIGFDGMSRHVNLEYPPEVLANKAEERLAALGYPGKPVARAYGLNWQLDYTQYVALERHVPDRWKPMRDGTEPGVLFWYRASDSPLIVGDVVRGGRGSFRVGPNDPPPVRAGDRRVWLDARGRLVRYESVPAEVEDDNVPTSTPVDWTSHLTAAGLAVGDLKPVNPQWVPLAACDDRRAWTGTLPGSAGVPIRVEAAAWHGKPVFFRVIAPWTRPERQRPPAGRRPELLSNLLAMAVLVLMTAGTLWLAHQHLTSGRADTRGALRLAAVVVGLFMAGWLLTADHSFSVVELRVGAMALAVGLLTGGTAWVIYVAFDSVVRRRWPKTVITWNRLLAGRFVDGVVGRDFLIGSVIGLFLTLGFFGHLALARLVGPYDPEPLTPVLLPLLGARLVGGTLINLASDAIMSSLTIFSLVFIVLLLSRREWVAVVVVVLATSLSGLNGGMMPVIDIGFRVVLMLILLGTLLRYGLVAFAVTNTVLTALGGGFPLSIDPSQWYSGSSIIVLGLVLALGLGGLRLALGGTRLFGPLEP